MDKTLGILGFGRIGQLVAERAPRLRHARHRLRPVSSAPSATASSASRRPRPPTTSTRRPTSSRCTCRRRRRPRAGSNAEALAKCKDGVRILNVARGPLIVDEDLQAALDSGKVGGAALDVFRSEPVTDHPLFGYPNVIVTPHLGASTAEATDRAGYQAAEQVVAALTGGAVTTAVNVPAVAAEDLEVLGPFLPLCRAARPPRRRAGRAVDRPRRGRVPRPHRRARHAPADDRGRCSASSRGHTEEEVNAGQRAADRRASAGSRSPRRSRGARARLHRPRARDGRQSATRRERVVGTTLGQPQPPAPARGVGPALQPPARGPPRAVPLPRRARHDRPRRHRARRARRSTSSRPPSVYPEGGRRRRRRR